VNQFLASHAVTFVGTGTLQVAMPNAGPGGVNGNGLWAAQSFTTAGGQAAIGWAQVMAKVTGSPPPLTVSVRANASGAPSGTPLVSSALPREFLTGTAASITVMLPVTGLTAGTEYWIVLAAQGDPSDYYTFSKSLLTSGASTSPDGVTWTAQAYSLMCAVWDQSAVPPLAGTWEDSGARWTSLGYNAGGQLTTIREYTAGQAANGYTASSRALAWTSGLLAGVA
jgi:hypothetical protein